MIGERELRLTNFRRFEKEVTLRIRPITVLIGKNNAGKSSLIKFLLMLKQSAGDLGKSYLLPNGSEVNLGGLDELKNMISRDRNLKFDLRTKEVVTPGHPFLASMRHRLTSKEVNLEHSVRVSVSYKRDLSHGTTEIRSFVNNNRKVHYKSVISPNSVFLREIKPGRGKRTGDEDQLRLGEECANNIVESLVRIANLSAAREELPLETNKYIKDMGYVGKQGKDALFCLWKENILNDEGKKEFLLRHTKKILNIDDLKIDEGLQFIATNARNSETGVDMSIANFGFGASQCIPIFIQGLMMPQNYQLIVEQPEAQVHPTAQLDLASFFVDLWNERDVGSIIETHSDNLMLRLRHEVARGNLKPEHVSIAYLSLDDSGTKATPIIKNLDIKPDGSLQEGLPMEFFGGDLTEVFNFMKEQAEQDSDE